MKDAFTQPRNIRPGCQHQLGCKCDIPYHLRASTEIEQAREQNRNKPVALESEHE